MERTVSVVGGAVLGLLAAIELSSLARRFGIELRVRVLEPGPFGGGLSGHAATPRCQAWWHSGAAFLNQPDVVLTLRQSAAYFRRNFAHAFRRPFAVMIDKDGDAAERLRVLRIPHTPISRRHFRAWLPGVSLPPRAWPYRIPDGVIRLRRLAAELVSLAGWMGVRLEHRQLSHLQVSSGRVTGLMTSGSDPLHVGRDDVVVLTCGAKARPLLRTAGLTVPGLRLFRSHLVATEELGIPSLLMVPHGPNIVPHRLGDGRLVDVIGNTDREELFPDDDELPLRPSAAAARRVVDDAGEHFGVRISSNFQYWPALKTELVLDGDRSQRPHAFRVSGLSNLYMAIPGKLSAAPATACELAGRVLEDLLEEDLTASIWERRADLSEEPVGGRAEVAARAEVPRSGGRP